MHKKPYIPLVDKTLLIKCSMAHVFEFLANHENYIKWFPGVVAISAADELRHGTVGKIYQETLRLPTGRHRRMAIRVVESRFPALFITEGTFAPVHPRMEIRLSEHSAQETSLNLRFLSRSQSVIARFLIRALVRKVFSRQSEMGLLQLRTILEEPSA